MQNTNPILNAFLLSLLAGLGTGIGGLIAVIGKPGKQWFGFLMGITFLIPEALALAGGVMVFITLDELLPAAREYGYQHYTAIAIILGAIFVFLLSGFFGV